jgi:hypothetical protein
VGRRVISINRKISIMAWAAILLVALSLYPRNSAAEEHKTYSLYVSECAADPCTIVDLVRYSFENGILQPEKIVATFPFGDVDSHLPEQLKKNLAKSDLTSEASEDIGGVLRAYSPDHSKIAYSSGDEIYTKQSDGTKTVLASGLSLDLSPRSNWLPIGAPFLWLDNDRIITQQKNGKIILVRTSEKAPHPESIADIPNLGQANAPPSFSLTPEEGTVLYTIFGSGGGHFKIDVNEKKYERLSYMPVGNQFDIEINAEKKASDIRYRGKSIGSYWCGNYAKTADGHIAVLYGPVGSNLGSPAGVAVWNRETGKWTEIKTKWGPNTIGWVVE